VEAHAAACSACAENLASFRALHQAMSGGALKEATPAYLRSRVEALAVPPSRVFVDENR
jgi:anti-sigma factor RsiW